ncbi:hypothetical protein K1T71_004479 [Dendrolimus kikuchii]|uniref:Uncharacterized protein n=1 Tax=Dendrolimus kikuchii TaxID=765133 RepID=A0ACC1D7J1_9NEOP|nr:hypothetical protein K1T71_004479 [Dendrolimus kikuchii]
MLRKGLFTMFGFNRRLHTICGERATSSDLRYSRRIRSTSSGTRGRSRRAALMSPRRPRGAGVFNAVGAGCGGRARSPPRVPLVALADGSRCTLCNAEATVLPTCPTSGRRACRTNPPTPLCPPTQMHFYDGDAENAIDIHIRVSFR